MIVRSVAPAAVVLLGVVVLAGCKSTTNTVSTTPAGSGAAAAVSAKPSGAVKPAGLGDAITVTGFNHEKLAVTLVKVFPDAKGADEFTSPDAGKVFYAVQLRIANAGGVAYSDSPDNGTVLKDAAGQQFQTDLASVTAGQSFGSVNIAPGDSVLGVVVFQVPNGDKPVRLQFTPDSGMADSTAQWNLP
ncbi:DUF4352 domain-containing protein [Actinocrinis sp.]|uniref:DUF4352 domain-containing protein n=1 Tax=Actinocrinis sp. TaxID=1920516 RepID=UPI002D3BB4EE|nr:DUF4352 domain-containing protein [Actinocrinis sp.]HZP55029.1 DUF4352 domain-containing protein [Actinocrinis sp.]